VLAVGAILECRRRGWSVPGRIAIASFDDVDLLSFTDPPVTTVRIPRYDIGRLSAEAILDRASGRTPKPVTLDLAFQIIQRGSV